MTIRDCPQCGGDHFGSNVCPFPPKPKRIQRSRVKGWKMPPGAVYVGRPSKWGNPFNARDCPLDIGPPAWARGAAVDSFREAYMDLLVHPAGTHRLKFTPEELASLKGHDLACWCPLNQPCHADVLLEIANRYREPR